MKLYNGDYEFKVQISGMFNAMLTVRNGTVLNGPQSFHGFIIRGMSLTEIILVLCKYDPDFRCETFGVSTELEGINFTEDIEKNDCKKRVYQKDDDEEYTYSALVEVFQKESFY